MLPKNEKTVCRLRESKLQIILFRNDSYFPSLPDQCVNLKRQTRKGVLEVAGSKILARGQNRIFRKQEL